MAEYALVHAGTGLPVPEPVPDDLAAALGNAGLAAWLPLSWRARMQAGETIVILGATGISGLIAVAAARLLGAGRIVAAGRHAAALQQTLSLGADAIIDLNDPHSLAERMLDAAEGGADIVVDYLNGAPAEAALTAMRHGGRMVQIGSPLSPSLRLDAQPARMQSLDVLGFAYYHAPRKQQIEAYGRLCEHALLGDIQIAIRSHPLDKFEEAWRAQINGSRARIVVIP